MEGMDGLSWLSKNNRKITINKRTLFDIVARDFSMDDVMTEALTNHLQRYILANLVMESKVLIGEA